MPPALPLAGGVRQPPATHELVSHDEGEMVGYPCTMFAALKLVLKDRPDIVALLIGLGTQLLLMYNITYPSDIFFDETHYVPAAQALLDLSAPRNVEHPLLGKELIALGMWLFGDNPWGWRLIPSLAATSTVVAGFSFLWLLTKSMRPAVIGALLILFNQMVFIQGRIAMLDVFLGAFLMWGMVTMLWAMHGTPQQVLRRWLLSAVLLGMAMAVKWSAVPYVALAGLTFVVLRMSEQPQRPWATTAAMATRLIGTPVMLVVTAILLWRLFTGAPTDPAFVPHWLGQTLGQLLLALAALAALGWWWTKAERAPARNPLAPVEPYRRWPGLGVIPGLAMLGVVSLFVYFVTFTPAFFYAQDPLPFTRLIPFQYDMYLLQTQTLKPHPYQSDWYSWPLMLRPLWYFYEYDTDAQRGVLLIGNPVIMWGGLVAVIACINAWLRDKAKVPLAMALLWIASLAIYIVIPKSLGFFYYYYLSSIFICFAIAVAFHHFDKGRRRGYEEWFLAASLLAFIYFYPIISAWPLSDGGAFNAWMWVHSWR
jgi:dolichyl-phosphate-mannose-protein mannosyltransferase